MGGFEHLRREADRVPHVIADSVNILGAKVTDHGMNEADVLFADSEGNQWYITIETADQYFVDTIEQIETVEPEDALLTPAKDEEPRKFIWNGPLNNDTVKEILVGSKLELIRQYAVHVPPADPQDQ